MTGCWRALHRSLTVIGCVQTGRRRGVVGAAGRGMTATVI